MRASLTMSRLVVPLRSSRLPSRHFSPHLLFTPTALTPLLVTSILYPACPKICTRGLKTRTTVRLDDLPQGLIPLEPLPLEQDENVPVYPTVVQQARDHMRKFDNCVLLTRVGGFYELYLEHADEFGPLLNLKVGSKKTANAPPISIVSVFQYLVPANVTTANNDHPLPNHPDRQLLLTSTTGGISFPSTRKVPENTRTRPQPLCCDCGRVPT